MLKKNDYRIERPLPAREKVVRFDDENRMNHLGLFQISTLFAREERNEFERVVFIFPR